MAVGFCSRTTLTRVTSGSGVDRYPLWTSDGHRLIFSSQRTGAGLFAAARRRRCCRRAARARVPRAKPDRYLARRSLGHLYPDDSDDGRGRDADAAGRNGFDDAARYSRGSPSETESSPRMGAGWRTRRMIRANSRSSYGRFPTSAEVAGRCRRPADAAALGADRAGTDVCLSGRWPHERRRRRRPIVDADAATFAGERWLFHVAWQSRPHVRTSPPMGSGS